MVAPGIQPSDGMVQAKRKRAEWPVGLVAATVGQKSPPEIIVENVRPWRFWEKVLIRLDSTAKKQNVKKKLNEKYRKNILGNIGKVLSSFLALLS